MRAETKKKLRRGAVLLSDLSPLILFLLAILFCSLPFFRLYNDETVREYQSVFGICASARESSEKTLSASGAQKVDLALAKELRPVGAVNAVLLTVCGVLSFLLAAAALSVFGRDPAANATNRIKNAFRVVFPGRWLHYILCLLPVLPLVTPYYVINRFSAYYRVKFASSAVAALEPEYYEYAVHAYPFNPLVIMILLAVLSLTLAFAAAGWRRALKADLFTFYEPEEESGEKKRNMRKR